MKKELTHEWLDHSIVIEKDDRNFSSCAQCLLDKPECGDICMTAGNRYHVGKVIRYTWYQQIVRFFRNLFYHHYSPNKN